MLFAIFTFLVTILLVFMAFRGLVFSLMYVGQWIRYRRPKIFPRPSICPRCELPLGRFQSPKSLKEFFLGGWTCRKCGSEFDQLDNIRIARAWNAHLRDNESRSLEARIDEAVGDDRSPVERMFEE